MKKIYLIVLAITLLLNIGCVKEKKDGLYKGYEIPPYSVISEFENIEIRQYEPFIVAEVEVEGSRKKAARKGFMALAGYIFGKNTNEAKINMTSPVSQENTSKNSEKIAMTSPVNQINQGEEKWLVQFKMPEKYSLETLPKPEDNRIKFKTIVKKKVVAIRFSGFWSDKKFTENTIKLKEFINEKGMEIKGNPIIAYYDDPFTLPWNRRNEIIFEIE